MSQRIRLLVACVALWSLWSLCANVQAWTPNDSDLEAAVNAGDFGAYFANLSAWLTQKVPADSRGITEAALKALLKDTVLANTLGQRQLLSKLGVAKMGAFALAEQSNRRFPAWLLRNTQAMVMLDRATSNLGFHYYGEGRFFILLGKSFADTMLELQKQ
jgi:hypothetical protein